MYDASDYVVALNTAIKCLKDTAAEDILGISRREIDEEINILEDARSRHATGNDPVVIS